ncbi:MAG: argininosuccinate lyase [Eubacteriales bacterium]|nr:argininosuccinate lyase [Eubacteriales bacterium]
MAKLWGGRFEKATSGLMDDFHSSISFDKRLFMEDITGSIAHARMLGRQGIIPKEDSEKIIEGLTGILADAKDGKIEWQKDAEDIHMNVEKILIERIGEAGKRLHTGRSRNDQVALDGRMYVKNAALEAMEMLVNLESVILSIAENNLDSIMPGYTHLQKAQPITLAHHMMAYFQMFLRDLGRFSAAAKSADSMPLGSGALAGTTYPLDRKSVADELGFSEITENSLDGVSDRDFMFDYIYAASVSMMHLSRFCEELILWSTNEFKFVTMDDEYSTGSSIMPQKKNPDVAELIRGKTGRVYGDLVGLLTVMKGIPLAYNKDMQEDKESLFDARDTIVKSLHVFTEMLRTLRFNTETMARGASGGFTNATDAADYLVKKGVPFRDAHRILGEIVLHAEKEQKALTELPLSELRSFSEVFDEDVYTALSMKTCVEQRSLTGGPAPETVRSAIAAGREKLKAYM